MFAEIPPKPVDFTTLPDAAPAFIKYKADDIEDLAPFDLKVYLADDYDICKMVSKMSPSWSRNGKYYTAEALKDMVKQVNSVGVVCHAGHINKETRSWEFFEEVGIWTGAIFDEEEQAAYFKGYVRPDKQSIKRSLRAGVINRISIEGVGTHQGDLVVNFDLRSIDLTNRFANATDSPVTAEMIDETKGGSEMPNEEKTADTLNGEVKVEQPEQPIEKTETAEQAEAPKPTPEEVSKAEELQQTAEEVMEASEKVLQELKDLLKSDNLKERVAELIAIENEVKQSKLDGIVSEALAEQVENETARKLVKRLAKFELGMTKEEVSEQIKTTLKDQLVEEIISSSPKVRFRLPKATPASEQPKGLQIIYTKEGE